MRGHEDGVSLIEILAATFLISIAIIPMLALYPNTLGISRETEYNMILGAAAARKMEEVITILRVAPVVFDASGKAGSGGATTFTCASMTIGSSANYLVILIGIRGTTAVSSVRVSSPGGACNTDSSASLLRAQVDTPDARRSELWVLLNPPTGTVNVQVNMAASIRHAWVAASFRNVLSATPVGGSNGNFSTGSTPSVTISPRTVSSMMVGGFFFESPGLTITQGGGQAAIDTAETTGATRISTHLAQEINQGDTGTIMDWTVNATATWVALAAELRGTVPVGATTGTATCTDLPNCLLVWTITTELSSTVLAVGTLQTLNVVACQDTNGNSACDAGERQVRYDAKITSHP